ncbi:MAG TPA: TfoX/Sxy family protein [Azospirillaceae bacterium]|nr:TfoX/Sxy family protein [Azospirillaceae bacterium]
MSRPVYLLPNLGRATAWRLAEVGIETEDDLRALGAAATYRRLKHAFPRDTSLNALWALAGALRGVHWLNLTPEEKAALKAEAGLPP